MVDAKVELRGRVAFVPWGAELRLVAGALSALARGA
jgi:hypothetical protein